MILAILRKVFKDALDDVDERNHLHQDCGFLYELLLALTQLSSVQTLVTVVYTIFLSFGHNFGPSDQFFHSLEDEGKDAGGECLVESGHGLAEQSYNVVHDLWICLSVNLSNFEQFGKVKDVLPAYFFVDLIQF